MAGRPPRARGLVVPRAGHPAPPALAALAPLDRAGHPPRARPAPAGAVRAAGDRAARRAAPGGGLHDRRLRGHPVLLAARVLRIPSVLWEGNAVPGRSVRLAARWRIGARGDPCRDPRGAAAPSRLRDRNADPVPRGRRPGRGPSVVRRRPGERILLVFGGSQAVRRINGAVLGALPRLVERARVIHVTGDDGYATAVEARERSPSRSGTDISRARSCTRR